MGISKYNSSLTIEYILTKGEDQYFDRKSSKIPIKKLADSMVAFANADGGLIAIGIYNGEIQGIMNQGNTKINDIIQCGFEKCYPPVKHRWELIDVTKTNKKDDQIILLHIEASSDKVHKTEADEVFLHVGDESKRLSHEQRLNLEYDRGSRTYEDELIHDCTLDDLDFDVLDKYKEVLEFRGNYEELLLARGFMKRVKGQLIITLAGTLMFAKMPTTFIPSARIRFFRYEGIEAKVGTSMNVSKTKLIEGPLPTMINDARSFIETQLREFTALDGETGRFIEVPEYPPFAWQEGVINAITHRAYSVQGDDIKVKMFDDRLEIHSPGKLPNVVNIHNIRETRYSRNPKIARALTEFGWVRELNEGVKRIFKDMEQLFLDPPSYQETSNSVILTLKNNIIMRKTRRGEKISAIIQRNWEALSYDEKSALEYMYSHDGLKTSTFAKQIKKSDQYARKILRNLEDKKIIIKVASSPTDPNTHFILNNNIN